MLYFIIPLEILKSNSLIEKKKTLKLNFSDVIETALKNWLKLRTLVDNNVTFDI